MSRLRMVYLMLGLISSRSTCALVLLAVSGIGFLPGRPSGATEPRESVVLELPGPVTGLGWLPDGRTMIARTARIEGHLLKPIVVSLDTNTGKQGYSIALGYEKVMVVSACGKWLAVAGEGNDRQAAKAIRLIDAATGKVLRTLTGHERAVTAVAFSHNGKVLASAGQDWLVKLWGVQSGKEIAVLKGHQLRESKLFREGWGLCSLAFAPDDTALISAGHEMPIRAGQIMLTQPGEFIVWDLKMKTPRAKFEVGAQGTMVRFLPDGKTAALLYFGRGSEETVCLVDLATGKKLVERDGFAAMFAFGFRADGAAFVQRYGGAERYPDGPYWKRPVEVWDLRAGKRIGVMPDYADHVPSLTLSPDGRVVATAGRDKTVRLWDAGSLKAIAKLEGHHKGVTCVAWSPDGSVLASGSEDRTVRLWNRPWP